MAFFAPGVVGKQRERREKWRSVRSLKDKFLATFILVCKIDVITFTSLKKLYKSLSSISVCQYVVIFQLPHSAVGGYITNEGSWTSWSVLNAEKEIGFLSGLQHQAQFGLNPALLKLY